jgi:phage shock protein A
MNKQLSNIDSSGTMAMLERMKEKVDEQEALAEAYGDMADESKHLMRKSTERSIIQRSQLLLPWMI